ncbi:hypothetical protein DICPUDRAFT_98718 [Dictyostelium purpureum]|uniref:50S ribosomal protein L9, chloroplastic n=1 Tax=Dictyostelium purpureum TaxID=5786 RepID=F0ZSY4_DICPU|nr:uncharacterized protein DICPUDRAFT_98718 [Dictyostelium purpureum]EGC32962.1 hypothetical protein DICPUDRAFT_98718 [Dictyostelium purpureum]|eukprot:XP_003290528.1 hypothetical protein DICPUDRAFT_98718 [Dictyostelium purpureum]
MISSFCLKNNKSSLSLVTSTLRQTESKSYYATEKKKVSVILSEDIPKVGQKGEELEVSKGFARNFFFMKGLAVHATHENRKLYEEFSKKIDYSSRIAEKNNAKAIKSLKKDPKITVMRRSTASGVPVETITPENISYSLKRRRGVIIDSANIIFPDQINTFGDHNIKVVFGPVEIEAVVQFGML